MAGCFISPSSRSPRKPRVSGDSRRCSDTTSASSRISSLPATLAPAARMRGVSPRALQASTSIPRAFASAMTRMPIAPVPNTPSVLPSNCVSISRGQAPVRISPSSFGMRRATASISAIVCSATALALTPAVLQTVTPRRCADWRSILSVPVPQIETSFNCGQAANTLSVKCACARILIATLAPSRRRLNSVSASAPRSLKTRISPSRAQRCSAGVPLKIEGKSSGTTISGSGMRETLPSGDGFLHEATCVELLGHFLVLLEHRCAVDVRELDCAHIDERLLHARAPESDIFDGGHDAAEQTLAEQSHVLRRHGGVDGILHRQAELFPQLFLVEAITHLIARFDHELFTLVALSIGELRVEITQRQPSERNMA